MHFVGISRAMLVIDAILTIMAVGGLRLTIRIFCQRKAEIMDEITFWRAPRADVLGNHRRHRIAG